VGERKKQKDRERKRRRGRKNTTERIERDKGNREIKGPSTALLLLFQCA